MMAFSWDITSSCNYTCDYCFFSSVHSEPTAPVAPKRMTQAWRRLFEAHGACRIYITGGEPFFYPGFTDVVTELSRFHRLHITSNLSLPLEDFIARGDPEKMTLNATFHPLHGDPDAFRDQVLRLRGAGFECAVCYLAHPLQLREMFPYKKYFSRYGIDMAVTQFSGIFDGAQFPSGYSAAQRELISRVEKWKPDRTAGAPGDVPQDRVDSHAAARRRGSSPEGSLCGAGVTYANVNAAGDVKRCGQTTEPVLGNIYRVAITLFDKAQPCPRASDCTERHYCDGQSL